MNFSTLHSYINRIIAVIILCVAFNGSIYTQTTGKSLAFDGANDYIDLGSDNTFGTVSNFSGDFTFEAWVYNDGSNTWARVFDFGDSQNDYIIFTVKSSDTGECRFEYRTGGGTQYKLDGGVFPVGEWTHVACRLAASGEVSIVLKPESAPFAQTFSANGWPPIANIVGTTKNYLGKSQFNDPYFKGKMKEVRVWKEDRSASQLTEWRDCELSGTEPNLIAYYKLNEGIVGANNNTYDFHVQNFGFLTTSDGVLKNFALTGSTSNWVGDSPSSFSEDPLEQNVVEFSNRGDAFLLNNESNFDFDSEYTVEYWLFPNLNWPTYQLPLIKGTGGGIVSFYSDHRDGNLYFGQIGSAGFQGVAAASGLEYNKWTHITLTAKEENGGITNKIYFDGVLKATRFHAGIQIPQTNEKVKLGSSGWFKMANVRFWDRALKADEIAPNISTIYPAGTSDLISQYVQYDNYSAGLVDNIGNNTGVRTATPIFSGDPCFVQFTQEPQDAEVAFTETITLSADLKACNDSNYSYQWQHNGVDITNETSLTLSKTIVDVNDLGEYQLIVTACGQSFPTRPAVIKDENEGKVLHFDGVDDYVSFSDVTGNSDYTVEVRVRFDEDPTNQNIIVNTDANEGLISGQLAVNAEGYLQHNMWSPNTGQMRSSTHPTKVRAHKWYNIELHYNGVHVWIEIDDVMSSQIASTSSTTDLPTWYLGKSIASFDAFHGEMDELRIWNSDQSTIVDQSTVAANAALVHYYQFNEGIAESDNNAPILVNTMMDSYSGSLATLYNFDLSGDESNWLGCDIDDLFDIIFPVAYSPKVTLGSRFTIEPFIPAPDGTETFQWYKDGLAIEGATNQIFEKFSTLSDEGSYVLEVKRFNECKSFSLPHEVFVKGTGEVLHFDGVNDYIEIQNTVDYNDRYTVECWIKFDDDITNQNIIVGSNETNGPKQSHANQLYTDENGFLTHYTNNDGNSNTTIKSLDPVVANQWYHVAIRGEKGQDMKLFVDGVLQGSKSINANGFWTGQNNWFIGSKARGFNGSDAVILNNFHGEMEELRIWRGNFPDASIALRKDTELNSTNTILTNGLEYYLKFNQGTANGNNAEAIIIDRIPNHSDVLALGPSLMAGAYYNFDFIGDESNFTNCSPITKPELDYVLTEDSGMGLSIGQPLEFELQIETGDTAQLLFQWLLDDQPIPGATEPLYGVESMAASDFGIYKIAIADMCTPAFMDTIVADMNTSDSDCYISYANPTNYPDSTRYTFCNDTLGVSSICGQGITLGGLRTNFGYCESETAYEGEEVVMHIPLAAPQVVNLTLQNIQADVDIFLFGDDCDIDNCISSSTNLGLENEFISIALPAGDYYLVIDEKTTSGLTAINDSLVLDIQMLDDKCSFSEPIVCGEEVVIDPSEFLSITSFIDQYGTLPDYNGVERFYELVITEATTINASLTGLNSDQDLFLLNSLCDEMNILFSSTQVNLTDESISYGVQPGTYYIIIDNKEGLNASGELTLTCSDYFDASIDETDAYIDLSWSIDKKACVPQDTGVIVRLITTPNTILYEQEYTTAALTPDVIVGGFRHIVGDDHDRLYVLRVSNRLNDAVLCNEVKSGSTLPFQEPEIISVSQAEAADSIKLVWRNHSQLSDEFRIYRDGFQIGSISEGYTEDSLIVSYVDRHDMNSSVSLEEASTYQYCIETHNITLNNSYTQVCGPGSTYDIGFSATDGGTDDMISLTWNDVSSFSDAIIISRNGIQQEILSANEVFWNDMTPIYGSVSEYKMTILRAGDEKMMVTDEGFIEANGSASGRVTTEEGGYPVQNASIFLWKDTTILNILTGVKIDSTMTDFEGTFSFSDIAYGLSKEFYLTAEKDNNDFTPEEIIFELNGAFPSKNGLVFIDNSDVMLIGSSLLDTLIADAQEIMDQVVINWDYTFSGTEVMHFILKRNGQIIYQGNDSNGKVTSFVDLTGVPGSDYSYTLDAFRYDGDEINNELRTESTTYPELTPIQTLDYTLDGQIQGNTGELVDPKITFDWSAISHPSLNFDGFRIFRNNILIGELGSDDTEIFSFITPPGETADYNIRAFKKINGVAFESTPYPSSGDTSITALPLLKVGVFFDPSAVPPVSDRAIVIDTDDTDTPVSFYENGVFTGVRLERKIQSSHDSTYVEIEDLTKQFIVAQIGAQDKPQIWDADGIPEANYTYRFSTYLDLDGIRYSRDTMFNRICPAIVGPANLQKEEEIGKVRLTWDDNSIQQGENNQLYQNYSGYEISRRDITNNGVAEVISELDAGVSSYNDFLSNPVYNLFFNTTVSVLYEYELNAFLDIDGIRYFSAPISIDAMPLDGSTIEPLPIDVMASTNIPGHIKLCWDWTATKPSQFNIYRDTVLLATMPSTARAYYDYDAPDDPMVLYKVSSIFNNNESQKVLAEGRMPSNMVFQGRIANEDSGRGIPGVNVKYRNIENLALGIEADEFLGSATSDEAGNYYIVDIPHTPGYEYQIDVFSNNADFSLSDATYQNYDSASITIDSDKEYSVDFIDYSSEQEIAVVSPIAAVTAFGNPDSMFVEIAWSPEHSYYDGFQVYRVNQLLAEVRKGEGFVYQDRGGFPGIDYTYSVRAYKSQLGGRTFSERIGARATFPSVLPVENMTVTAFSEMNRMLVAWSHPLDNHDSYRIRRNGQFMANIPTGEVLMWYDSTGVPGLEYQYEIAAVKGARISESVVVNKYFKGVGEARNLMLEINTTEQACSEVSTNDNHVSINWEYEPGAADGFEIYRDDVLIAEIDSIVLSFGNQPIQPGDTLMIGNSVIYDDYEGEPDVTHSYHILPYVIRDGDRYTSGIEELYLEESIAYPVIAEVKGLDAAQNAIFGSGEINFSYPPYIVDGFEILRDGIVIDQVIESNQGSYTYQDFTGTPGQSYTYTVRAYDNRNGTTYAGSVSCNETLEYPVVPAPGNLTASKGTYENHIQIDWAFSAEAFVDSFYLENITLGATEVLSNGKRKFIQVVNQSIEEKYDYRIRGSRVIDGQTIYSDWSDVDQGWSGRQITGDEDEMIVGNLTTTWNGFATDIEGDWAVSGAPKGKEQINIYKRVNGGWSLSQTITSPYPADDYDFGHSVAITENIIVVGMPKKGNGEVIIYELEGDVWNSFPQIIASPTAGKFGWSVDIDGDDLVVGNPDWIDVCSPFNTTGAIYFYERTADGLWIDNGSSTGNESSSSCYFRRYGHGLALEDGFLAVSWNNVLPGAAYSGIRTFMKNSNDSWEFIDNNSALNYSYSNDVKLYDNIDYADQTLVIGTNNEVMVIEMENNQPENTIIINSDQGCCSDFGHSVAVAKVSSPIDDYIYVAIGSIGVDDFGLTDVGYAGLYSNVSGAFVKIDEILNDNPGAFDGNGFSVALSKDAWVSGIYRDNENDAGSVTIKNHLKAPISVVATDGISLDLDPTETTISWQFDGNFDILAGFNIYRDGEFLTYADKATMDLVTQNLWSSSWNDNSGEAGFSYIYSVASVNNGIPFESYGVSDEGYNSADGRIIGSVKTKQGLVPVPGVLITATGLVDSEVYTYTTTTQPNGEYIFSSVYYDPTTTVLTEYEVTAEYLDHNIIPQQGSIASLNPLSDPSQGVVDFFDETAYVIKGTIAQPDVDCPLEGIRVTQIVNGVESISPPAFTDADGNYTLVINPFEEGLQELIVRVDNSLTVDDVTTTYNFVSDQDTVLTDFTSIPIVTEINFNDVLTYNVPLKVKNTCNDPMSNGKWTVRVRTLDGCFDQSYVTDSNGDLIVPLLPLNYTMKVVGVDVATSLNQQALDYYANFPVSLNLLDLHRDSIETLTKVEIEDLSARQFTFHKAAQIEVSGLNDMICNTQTAILQQGVPYTLSMDIFETHNGSNCPVQEGIVVITNPASEDSDPVTINYNEVQEKFDDYTFVTGGPSQIFPHAYAVTFDYKTIDGIFLGRLTRVVFVEGSVALPGTDILVDPASGNDAVPYPLLVLRDPPGDGSSSYISAEQTISFDTEMSMDFEFGAKLYTEVETKIIGVGTEINANINGGYTSNETIQFSNSVTTATTISTSSAPENIGRSADVIVGTGMVMQFGYIVEYRVADDECSKIQRVTRYGISPNAATTTWSYQVGQIEEIIQGYVNDSLRVEEGTLIIERFGKELSTADARVFLHSNITNWTQVLHYHDVETVPYYYLCTLDPIAAGSPGAATQIGYWQAQIRPFFGAYEDGVFVLNEDIVWDDQLINIYNAASAAIRNLLQGADLSIWSFPYIGDQSSVDLNVPLGDFNLVDLVSILVQPSLQDYTNNFGDQVKNITTGGNVLIEESVNNAQASTTSQITSVYLGTELDVAVVAGGSSEIVVGTFAGVGGGVTFATVEELFKTEVKIGAAVETKFTRANSYASTLEESVEVGYSIFDDDNEDAFSFAVVQAVTPNSTPYFDFFGGHSSCPPEEGSVFVDAPKMAIVDQATGGTSQTKELFNIAENEPATFYLVAENQSPIASAPTRDLEITLDPSSNPFGAIVTLNGVSLNNSTFIGSFAVGEPMDLILTLERGPISFDYTDIQVGIQPTCGDGPVDYIYVSAHFVNPCSPVTLVSPIENWVINDDTTKLVVTMQDHDPNNPFLVDATLQYRRIGTGASWKDVPGLELEKGNFIIPDTLSANDDEYAEGQIPKYFFIWTIPTSEGTYPDGDYEVRTKMTCDNFTSTLSNVIAGKIARDGLNLFGTPQPADQVWIDGDEISFSFNNDLDCALINSSFITDNVSVYNETTQQDEPFTLSCYANKVIFVLDNPMSDYDGQFLTIKVNDIPSIEGNTSLPHEWTFRVITSKIYWADADTVKVRMYQDEVQNITHILQNSTTNETIQPLSLEAANQPFDDWITLTDPTDASFAVNPSGRPISFEINAAMPVGIYNETVNVIGVSGVTPQLHIQLEVLVKAPDWVVDPSNFTNSMTMISNWKYTSDPEGTISEDEADLISVWIDGKIRGVGQITQSGQFFASYLTVYGNPNDGTDTQLEFRIWDADLGIEYDGHPLDPILYKSNSIRGTTKDPEVLEVDAEYDKARYISLNQGWTGFSLHTTTTDMDVMHKLRTLNEVTDGDLIVTGDKFSQYTDSLGWFNFGDSKLETIDNNEGYMIYLQNGPDTLRVTGAAADTDDFTLRSGWNWIGFPFENSEAINDVLNLNAANATGNDRIKLDFPLPAGEFKSAFYNLNDDNWNNGNLDDMEPNNLYKLFSGNSNGAILSWDPENNAKGEEGEELAKMSAVVDPNDPTTWVMPDLASDEVMPIIAEVLVSGIAANDPADMVAFFENDTIRALGSIEYIDALMVYEVSMLAESTSGTYDIRYYDASEGTVSQATNLLSFDINGVGDVFDPYEIIFDVNPCNNMLIIGPSGTPFALDKTFEASQEIRVTGNLNIPAGVEIILSAPKVTIADELNAGSGAQVIVRPDGCN